MKLSLVGLENEHGAFKQFDVLTPAPKLIAPDGTEVLAKAPLHVTGTVTNTGPCYHVSGEIEAKLSLVCARCLERYLLKLKVPLIEDYAKSGSSDEQEDWRSFQGDEIELDGAIEEELYLNLPLRGLCDKNCQGLCPICGTNRNREQCNCKEERVDPRLAVLSKLLDNAPGGGGKDGTT